MTTPKVSIIMGVFNGENFLRPAMDSILNQTFEDFEFIIIDDGSSDASEQIVKSYTDSRIKFVKNERNLGIAATMNKALGLTKGEYIAKMDCDDISMPNRFALQVKFMDKHPNVGICGAWVKVIGDPHEYVWKYETNPAKIKVRLLFACALANPTVMMRRAMLTKYNLNYQEEVAEDYQLWTRAAEFFDISNIPKVLLFYRLHPTSNTKRVMNEVQQSALEINRKQILRLGINPSADELLLHNKSCTYDAPVSSEYVSNVSKWFNKLEEANKTKKIYDQAAFNSVLGFYWYALLVRSIGKGSWVKDEFFKSPAGKNLSALQKIKFLIKYVLKAGYAK